MQSNAGRARTLVTALTLCAGAAAGHANGQVADAGAAAQPGGESGPAQPGNGRAGENRGAAADDEAPVSASVESVVEDPGRYYGRVVTVRGEIEDTVGPRSFTLDEDSLEATTDLFVLLPHAASGLREDSEVSVTGRVRRFVHDELRREHDWFDATPDVVAEHEGQPVIVAESVRSEGGDELLNPDIKARERGLGQDSAAGFGDGASGRATPERAAILTPAEIARDPGRHLGKEVIVSGRIEDVLARTLFTLDEDARVAGPDVLVLNPRPALPVDDGARVTVSGELRRFSYSALRREFPWLELKQALVDELQGRPMIVAEAVASGAQPSPPARRAPARGGAR